MSRGWFERISLFLRPDINMIIKTAVEGFVSPSFELPDPESIPSYIKSSRPTLSVPRGLFYSLQGDRRNTPFLAPELGQEFYLKSLHLCPSTVLVGHIKDVFCLTYDCTGHRLITGSDDSLIKVWDIKTGGLIFTLKGHNAPISDFHIFEDGQHLISCDTEGFVVLWDLAYGIVKAKRKLGRCCITNIFFLPANFGKTFSFFAAGDNGICYHQEMELDFFFDPDLTKISQHLYKAKKMLVACRNPTGTLIAYGGEDFMIYIAQPTLKVSEEELEDVEDICRPNRLAWGAPQIKTILHGHTFSVATLEFNKSGERLLSSSQDNTARVWSHDPSTEVWSCVIMGEEIDFELDDGTVQPLMKGHRVRESMLTGLEHNICSAVWASDDNIIMVSYDSGLLRMFCSHSGHLLCSNQLSEFPIHALAPHPTRTDFVLVACYQGKVAIINACNGRQVEFWDYKEEYCFIEAKWSPTGDHFSLSAEGGKCFTYASALDIGHTVPAISGAQQCLSTDFVSLPSTSSFPMHGTETRRNEFKKYDLKTFACDTQPEIFQKPADFGKEYTCTALTEAPCDPSTIAPLLEHLRWKSLGTTNELPKLYQYKKYRREHLGLFQEAEINEDMEPLVLPQSPKDADYVQTSNVSSEDEPEDEPGSEASLIDSDLSFVRSFSPLRTRRRAREIDSPEKSPRRNRRNRFPVRATRAQTMYVESGHSQISGSESNQEDIIMDPAQLEELAGRMNISEYPLPDGVLLDNEWAKLIDQPTGSYFPQVNDPIVYLPSGHREYAANCNIEPVLAQVPAIEGLPRFSLTEYGVVQTIKFYIDNSVPLAEICLKFKSGATLKVVIGPHLPRFIVHQATYDAAALRHVSQGSLVQLHGRGEYQKVVNVSTDSDPWNAFQLQGLEGRFGIWELFIAPPLVSLDTATVAKYTRVIRQLSQDSHFDLFVDQIDLATYPEYVSFVPVPMFLSLISLRLRNNFYRCEEAFMQDLQQIHTNARAFNLPKSEIVYQAKALVVRAKALIQDAPKPESSSESESSSPIPSPRRPKRSRPVKASTQRPKSKLKAPSDPEYGSEEIESLASSGSIATLDDSTEEDSEDDAPRKRARKPTSSHVTAPRKSRQAVQGRSLRPRQQVNYVSNIHFSDSSEAPPSRRPQRNIVVSDDD
ncbi:hypothetical protein DSO57_1017762 [Entomophthora muscae]|uniref:Uncharacterized protein n=1 Tax=Entomophthora muscae TaxID=34485 RepID=A0ACC2RIZ5_9FUNG|nr:hypothetical protein DSO57_1017762 [Entomophthora muscae]